MRRRSLGHCEVCGGPGYQFSHRRGRAVRDEHRWCACNGLLACQTCHSVMHRNPDVARSYGHHVSTFESEPSKVPVKLLGKWWSLRCDGTYEWLRDEQVQVIHGAPVQNSHNDFR